MMARALWALLALAILIAAGIGYEQVERRRDRARFPQVGRSVDIGGRSLNIYCSGEGAPAVVLESDALTPGFAWVAVQRELAKFTRACWYDRAGYGWSDPAPAPHSSSASAHDLHVLLKAAGVAPPYVLAGARTLREPPVGPIDIHRRYRTLKPQAAHHQHPSVVQRCRT